MANPVILRFNKKDYELLKQEAKSIPSSLSTHLKWWILHRNETLQNFYDDGYKQCMKDYHIKSKNEII